MFEALSTVDLSEDKTYGDAMHTGAASELYNYDARFSLILNMPIRQSDFPAFKSSLLKIWEQSRPGRRNSACQYNCVENKLHMQLLEMIQR